MDREELYDKAWDEWGEAQYGVLQEECAELIAATSHFLRKRDGAMEEFIEELADVYIMVEQHMHNLYMEGMGAAFTLALTRKRNRLANRLGMKDE